MKQTMINKPDLQTLVSSLLGKYFEIGSPYPPIMIRGLAKAANIGQILMAQMPDAMEASIRPEKGQFILRVNKESFKKVRRRVRYSCAHEIAHTFFYNYDADDVPLSRIDYFSEQEEMLCDKAAAMILMPEKIVRDYVNKLKDRHNINTCKILIEISNIFDVSLQAASCRLFSDLDLFPEACVVCWGLSDAFPTGDKKIMGELNVQWIYHGSKFSEDNLLRKRMRLIKKDSRGRTLLKSSVVYRIVSSSNAYLISIDTAWNNKNVKIISEAMKTTRGETANERILQVVWERLPEYLTMPLFESYK